jgi:multidrug efflux pump subunit AcrB
MTRTFVRTAIAAMAMACLAVAAGTFATQAKASPQVQPDTEYVTTYYSTAAHTTVVGQVTFGCTSSDWGSRTSYYTDTTYACTP